jgi:hypothetical protein
LVQFTPGQPLIFKNKSQMVRPVASMSGKQRTNIHPVLLLFEEK